MSKTATVFFRSLADLMLSMTVFDVERRSLDFDEGAARAVAMILAIKSSSGKIMVVGNGGSASIADHVHNDLCKAVGVQALAFSELPLMTALSNDHGFECVYERPVELWAAPGDLLIAISSSGQSENILRAVRAARNAGCQIITLSGFNDDNPLHRMGDLNFYVPSRLYGYVEMVHSALTHFLTDSAVISLDKTGG